jgi:hypothetical protein
VHALFTILVVTSANMLKAFVTVGEAQVEPNCVLATFHNPPASKKTPILGFVTRCFKNGGSCVAVDEGSSNIGGILAKMKFKSLVPGCFLGLYQEERSITSGLGISGGDDDADAAALFRIMADGGGVSLARKTAELCIHMNVTRLNMFGNGHITNQLYRCIETCSIADSDGTGNRLTSLTVKPQKADKGNATYVQVTTAATDKRVEVIITLVLCLVRLAHTKSASVLCERAAAAAASESPADDSDNDTETSVLPEWIQHKLLRVDPTDGQAANTISPTDPAFYLELVQIAYGMTEEAWRRWVVIHTNCESNWWEQLSSATGKMLTTATLEGKAAGTSARWSLPAEAFSFWADVVVAEFESISESAAVADTLPPVPAGYNMGVFAKRLFDNVLDGRPDFDHEISVQSIELGFSIVDFANKQVAIGAGFDPEEAARVRRFAAANPPLKKLTTYTLMTEVIAATPGKYVAGFLFQREQVVMGSTISREFATKFEKESEAALMSCETAGIGTYVEDITKSEHLEEFADALGTTVALVQKMRKPSFKRGFIKSDLPASPNGDLELSEQLKNIGGVGVIAYRHIMELCSPKYKGPTKQLKRGNTESRSRENDTSARRKLNQELSGVAASASTAARGQGPFAFEQQGRHTPINNETDLSLDATEQRLELELAEADNAMAADNATTLPAATATDPQDVTSTASPSTAASPSPSSTAPAASSAPEIPAHGSASDTPPSPPPSSGEFARPESPP